ncbi:Pectin lyase-like superfamily protein [Citrus sinensis]|uniref:polygalacturonase-like n=1 Tax=Citrus sinensis TaxID=2711 RepID=UPI002192A613|nr:polygalacturonase-like [Citrus sinensis]KAH9726630.1 Pectin lyase-like superfamily protein [Citrus sinensis]
MAKLAVSCILFIFFINTLFQSASAAYNVINFGAKPDGKSDDTQAFLRAWSSACYSNSPATLHVPRGLFLVKSISFNGPCRHRIVFQIDGTIIAPSSYWSLGNSGFWILFYKVNRLSIHGGTIDATGAGYWACRKSGKSCPPPTRSISFVGASNIVVSGLTSINSRFFHIAIDECVNIMLRKLKINAPSWSPNTDGIHIQSSSGITISNSAIMTGDDCISVGPGTKNLWIERIACGPGHGISIGSLGAYAAEDGAKNVTVTDSIFTGTQNGVRIKTWARPSNGFARNIRFRNIIMTNVFNPIIIDQNYCPDNHCPHQSSGMTISGVTYRNIEGTSATPVAINFGCSSSKPCTGIKLQGIVSQDEYFAQLIRVALRQFCRLLLSKPRASRTREESNGAE